MTYRRGYTTDRAQPPVRRGVAGLKGVAVVAGDLTRVFPRDPVSVPSGLETPLTGGDRDVIPVGAGDPGEQTVYVQPDDPGAVGAGKLWVDTSEGTPLRILIRNPDDEWVDLLSDYIAAGVIRVDSTNGNLTLRRMDDETSTADVELSSGGLALTARDDEGVETGSIVIDDEIHFSADNTPEIPASPTEQDIVNALLALGLVTQAAP